MAQKCLFDNVRHFMGSLSFLVCCIMILETKSFRQALATSLCFPARQMAPLHHIIPASQASILTALSRKNLDWQEIGQ